MSEPVAVATTEDASNHQLVLAFGRLQGAANRLEYLLGRALEETCGISHLTYEVLLILGRAGEPVVDPMEASGLVERVEDPHDRRGRLARLTPHGRRQP